MRRNLSPFKDLFKTPQQKTYTLLGVTVIVVAVFFLFAIRPAYYKIAEINKDIEANQIILNNIETKISNLQHLKSLLDSIEQDRHYFEEAFPDKPEAGFLVANFAAIAETHDLILGSVEFSDQLDSNVDVTTLYFEAGDTTNLMLMKVDLSISGEIENIEDYVSYLEKFPRIMDIQNVSYNKNGAIESVLDEGQATPFHPYTAQIDMIIMYYNDPALIEEEPVL